MSDKKYEITFEGDKAIIKEAQDWGLDPGKLNFSLSFRERVGFKMRGFSKAEKVFLTCLFNIYGLLGRWGSNSGLAFSVAWLALVPQIYVSHIIVKRLIESLADYKIIFDFINGLSSYPWSWIVYIGLSIWAIDILCVILTGDIRLFGHKTYKDVRD